LGKQIPRHIKIEKFIAGSKTILKLKLAKGGGAAL
jgi:hypothetical protein